MLFKFARACGYVDMNACVLVGIKQLTSAMVYLSKMKKMLMKILLVAMVIMGRWELASSDNGGGVGIAVMVMQCKLQW